MQSKSNVLLKVLLNKYHPGPPQAFLKCLPPDEVKEVAAVDTASNDITPALTWPQDIVSHTHYSWLAPVIEKMPKHIQLPIVASLPQPQNAGVGKMLKLPVLPAPPPSTQAFLLAQLYKAWNPTDALPREYLPKTSLEALLTLSKADLVDLIDLLAMYDLSDAIRHIVDKKYLKKIYQCLSPQNSIFCVNVCTKKKNWRHPNSISENGMGAKNNLTPSCTAAACCALAKPFAARAAHFCGLSSILWTAVGVMQLLNTSWKTKFQASPPY